MTGAWHKTTAHGQTAFGTGYRLRSACEPFLIGTRGKPVTTKSVRNLIVGEAREHSRKPDEAFTAAERLMRHGGCHAAHGPARRIEVFSRETRPGWDNWGLERTKFNKETTQ